MRFVVLACGAVLVRGLGMHGRAAYVLNGVGTCVLGFAARLWYCFTHAVTALGGEGSSIVCTCIEEMRQVY